VLRQRIGLGGFSRCAGEWVGGFPAAQMGGWFLGAPMGESHRYHGVGDRACGWRNFEVDSKSLNRSYCPLNPVETHHFGWGPKRCVLVQQVCVWIGGHSKKFDVEPKKQCISPKLMVGNGS
jgi:hypothetical protein